MKKEKLIFEIFLLCSGILVGVIASFAPWAWVHSSAQAVAEIFMHFLKLISLPMIFLSIIATMSGMSNLHEMRYLGRKVFSYTLITTLFSASVALGLFLLIKPLHIIAYETSLIPNKGYLGFLINIVPENFVKSFLENHVIGVAFLAILMGSASLVLPQHQKATIHQFFQALFALFLQITRWVLRLMPLGIAAFTYLLFSDFQSNILEFKGLSKYLGCVLLANLVQGVVILPLFLLFKKHSALKVFKGMLPALILAFFSKSSNATMPVAMNCCEKKLGVDGKISQFTLPLCSVINMNGCAAFILITTLFVATSYGITFSLTEMCGWIILATIAAIGNAGIPMGCFFLTSAFLTGMNVPLKLMGIILPFYALIDMVETSLNVWSDGCVTVLVDKDLKRKQVDEYCADSI